MRNWYIALSVYHLRVDSLCREVSRPADSSTRHPERSGGTANISTGHTADVLMWLRIQHRRILQGHVCRRGAVGRASHDMFTCVSFLTLSGPSPFAGPAIISVELSSSIFDLVPCLQSVGIFSYLPLCCPSISFSIDLCSFSTKLQRFRTDVVGFGLKQ